jgi:anti-anti-sigma factor
MTPDISLTASLDRCASLVGFAPRQERPSRARFVPSPSEPLVGGAAEAFDQQIQKLFRNGQRQVTVDLSAVSTIDEAGIRALVRGATSAQRVGGLFRLAAVRPAVARALELSDLSSAFEIYDSVAAARIASWPWRAIRLTAGGIAVCGALVWAGLRWPVGLAGVRDATQILASGQDTDAVDWFQPFIELLKLVAASLVGLLITAIHQPNTRDHRSSMGQAQTLLCVSGAVMMIIIGNSLARAFGIAGAASIIRFRTPVDDPKDVTVLFLLMGLGMSIGLGAFAVAGLGAAFLCVALIVLNRTSIDPLRVMSVELSAHGPHFPTSHVEGVFARHRIAFEPREILTAEDGVKNHKYLAWLDPRTSLEELNAELMTDGAGLTAVAWAHAKRERS